MATTWKHPRLGEFEYDDFGWAADVSAPAFQAFDYSGGGYDNAVEGMYRLEFQIEEEQTPSDEMTSLAAKVLMNQEKLAADVANLIWDQFNGRGPHSGMWWYGDMKSVTEWLDDEVELTSAGDIYELMALSSIMLHPEIHGYQGPVVELCFHARFEKEHGVGVLTDGERIVGVGYMADPNPFNLKGE